MSTATKITIGTIALAAVVGLAIIANLVTVAGAA